MTVSTAGIVPRIRDFGEEEVRPKLAISLNASNDALRTQLMPLNKKWNLEMLLAAARDFPLRTRVDHVRICAARWGERCAGECAGSCRVIAWAALQGESDRAESGAGD